MKILLAVLIVAAFLLVMLGFLIFLWKACQPVGTHISLGNDPSSNCSDCQGEGIVGDNIDCPCTMRFHSC